MAEEPGGFLGRWARRKNDALRGQPANEPPAPEAPAAAAPEPLRNDPGSTALPPHAAAPAAAPSAMPAEPPPLTLSDAQALTKDSDFKPFMAGNVGPDVRNAAMKKLFADPHFNVMDGLDTYIDDYSISDPIPESMLRQMASAKFLKLFDDEKEDGQERSGAPELPAAADAPRENANNPMDQTVAQSSDAQAAADATATPLDATNTPETLTQTALPGSASTGQPEHAHTDLRLQPDNAAPARNAGGGA